MRLSLSLLALLFAVPAGAASDVVRVRWQVSYSDSNGDIVKSAAPDKKYLQTLTRCGFNAGQPDLFPVKGLRCQGVLNFSQSAKLRARVKKLVTKALAGREDTAYQKFLAELSRTDFGISPYGIFRVNGLGDSRRVGINLHRLVVLNAHHWQPVAEGTEGDAFLLHEALGAAGIEDQDYRTSLEIAEGKLPNLSGSGTEIARSGDGGGLTVVVRGGDPDQQAFKKKLLKKVGSGKLRSVVLEAPIVIKNYFSIGGQQYCRSLDQATVHQGLCGGVGRLDDGAIFVLVAREFKDAPAAIQKLFLEKIEALLLLESR